MDVVTARQLECVNTVNGNLDPILNRVSRYYRGASVHYVIISIAASDPKWGNSIRKTGEIDGFLYMTRLLKYSSYIEQTAKTIR